MKLSEFPLFEVDDLALLQAKESCRVRYLSEEFEYECFLQLESSSNWLVVILHGAKNQNELLPPYFDRWSWKKDIFKTNVLNISDATLQLKKDMKLGWYLGNNDEYVTGKVVEIVDHVSKLLVIPKDRIVFWGSSGGGFAAMQSAALLDGSNAVAINPQTNVLNYYKGHVKTALKECFDDHVKENIKKLSFGDRLKANYNKSNFFLFQNVNDVFHYNKHFLNLKEELGLISSNVYFEEYFADRPHGPEYKDEAVKFFNYVKASLGNE